MTHENSLRVFVCHRSHADVNFGPLACTLQPPLVTSPSAGSSHHLVPPGAIQQCWCCTNHHLLALLTLCCCLSPIQHPQGPSNDAPSARTSLNFRVRARSRVFSPHRPPASPHHHPLALLPAAAASRHPTPPGAIQQHPWCTNGPELRVGVHVCFSPPPTWFAPPPPLRPPRPPPPPLAIQHPQGPSNDAPGARTAWNCDVQGRSRSFCLCDLPPLLVSCLYHNCI
ncbi:unnamed protein product [Cyclocybe aegerita]|uniref:Uncharacterized protein n=1 Tax=Cyclocybe aegerita TaxID=1973307 RepID=A0A8S0WPC0_CYCAE|nr:unnamed protein product [Cyclocybe aegerita]